jgi:hypothetical protein
MTIRFTLSAAAVAAATLFATAANAAPCTGVSLGTSATGDFTLGGVDSDACVISTVNPDQGPNGNPSGFSPTPFGTGWTLLAKVNSDSSPTSFDGVSFVSRPAVGKKRHVDLRRRSDGEGRSRRCDACCQSIGRVLVR